ncbi:type II secretion system protein GspM [Massilia sp. TSP1-1-2]|uniref:type II secretion system protein GspM n=1 Tax=Massilia sp. TSP1-1-2 TaxID=2804649 RepID=UPI003CF4B738
MSAVSAMAQFCEQVTLYWLARTEQERKYLTIGGATIVGALVYMLFIAPPVEGRARLNAQLPAMRVEASKMQALALEAGELARQPVLQVTPMTRETLTASLTARSLAPTSLVMSGEFAKIQFNGVAFAGLYSWIDAQRRENRIDVQEIAVTAGAGAGATAGQVDAAVTLHQITGEASR